MPEFTASESDESDEESDHGHDDEEEEEGTRGEGGADDMYWLDGVSALRTQRRLLLRELHDRGALHVHANTPVGMLRERVAAERHYAKISANNTSWNCLRCSAINIEVGRGTRCVQCNAALWAASWAPSPS